MNFNDMLTAIWRSEPDLDSTRAISWLAQLLYTVNAPCLFEGRKYKRLRDVPTIVLQRVVKQTASPLAGLVKEDKNTWDGEVILAKWELARRDWVIKGGEWNMNYHPYKGDK